jgi:hypothetical protein
MMAKNNIVLARDLLQKVMEKLLHALNMIKMNFFKEKKNILWDTL